MLDLAVELSTPQDRAMAQMLSVCAELERELIGARTREALAAKVARARQSADAAQSRPEYSGGLSAWPGALEASFSEVGGQHIRQPPRAATHGRSCCRLPWCGTCAPTWRPGQRAARRTTCSPGSAARRSRSSTRGSTGARSTLVDLRARVQASVPRGRNPGWPAVPRPTAHVRLAASTNPSTLRTSVRSARRCAIPSSRSRKPLNDAGTPQRRWQFRP